MARAARILARALGRGGSRPSAAAVLDSLRRGAHVLRHSRVVPRRARGGVFDLDLHVAVVADVRTQLEERGVPLTEWSVSGHTWAFGRRREPVAVVNEKTWFAFGPARARRFRRFYGSYLRSFDGFLATYPPAFALLYEGFGKPTLAIAATRYEWPFTHNDELWRWLDDGLRRGVEDGWLTLAANNRADADYLRHHTGLDATHVPSACAYAAGEYTGRERAVVVCTPSDALAGTVCGALQAEAIPLRGGLGARYTRADLYARRALVFIPYNVSIMALFEHYSACAPIYVPGPEFLKALMAEHPADVLSSVSFSQVTGRAPARAGDGLDLNDLGDERVVDWYLERADFYDREWMPHVRRFDSWAHLDELLAADDQAGISAEMRAAQPERLARIAALWDELGWTGRVRSAAARA